VKVAINLDLPLLLLTLVLRCRFNATSHSRVLHTQVHNPLLARESTRTSRLGNRVEETRLHHRSMFAHRVTLANKHLCIASWRLDNIQFLSLGTLQNPKQTVLDYSINYNTPHLIVRNCDEDGLDNKTKLHTLLNNLTKLT